MSDASVLRHPLEAPARPDMVFIPGGRFSMGSEDHYPEEAPVRRVSVGGFWIDRAPVTNRRFDAFVTATGWTTLAERPADPELYPGAPPERLAPSSMVFTPPPRDRPIRSFNDWWAYVPGADWRHPAGPSSSLEGLEDHPVVHVALEDVLAYAAWAGADLPSEAEWEFAARGGMEGAPYAWGDQFTPGGRHMANTWQGDFPFENLLEDGWPRTSPVGAFPANGYGLVDMIGNVWEWTQDWWSDRPLPSEGRACCAVHDPVGGRPEQSYERGLEQLRIARRVLKGGSHLCAPNYCRRYRPAARHAHPEDTSASHVGFRCVIRPPARGDCP